MEWLDKFCSRFDGIVYLPLWLERLLEEDVVEEDDPRLERERRLTDAAGKLEYRAKQAESVRAHVQAVLTGDMQAQLLEIVSCGEGVIEGARRFKQLLEKRMIDAVAVYNKATGNITKTAKQQDSETAITKRVFGMLLAPLMESLKAIFDEYHGQGMTPGKEEAVLQLRRGILRLLDSLQKEFGDFTGLKDFHDTVRGSIGPVPEKTRSARGKTSLRPGFVLSVK